MDSDADPGEAERALTELLWEARRMSIGITSKRNPETCSHAETITVNTVGLQRAICETCGHVSIRSIDDIYGQVSRTAFAREADQLRTTDARHNVMVKHMAGATASA